MRTKVLTIALLLVLPFFVTACTLQDLPVIGKFFGGTSLTNKPVTINIWGLWENTEAFKTISDEYTKTHPNVTVNYEDRSVVKPDQFKDTVVTRLSQGDVPDVVLVHNSWVSDVKDMLSPMPSSLINASDYTTKFYPSATDHAVIGNQVYAVPAYYDGLVLVYNKKHFEEVEQTKTPTSWEEFRRLALTLTKKDSEGVIVRAGAAIGTANNIDFFSDILGLMLAQAGVSFPSGLDSTKAADALSFYTMFVSDGVWNSIMPEASTAFAQEKASMIFVPTWNLLDIIKARPDLDIGVAPVPQAVEDSPISWGSFWMYAVPQKSANQQAAWEFINYLASDETQKLLFSEASKYRTYGAPFAQVSLASQIDTPVTSKYLKPLMDQAPFSVTSELAGRAGNALQTDALKEAINSQFLSDVSTRPAPVEALKTAKTKILAPQK